AGFPNAQVYQIELNSKLRILGAATHGRGVWEISVNNPPTVATPASASPSPVAGTTTNLSVLGADDTGEGNLVYTWATAGTPPAAVIFSGNGTNADKNVVATFAKAGNYSFQVTMMDPGSLTTTTSLNVTVTQTVTSLTISPTSATVAVGEKVQFTATAFDQFKIPISPQPPCDW